MQNQKLFTTRDIYMAASLITLDFYMVGVDYQIEGSKPVGYFNFEENEKLREIIHKYRQGKILVEPKTFVTNMRELKSEVSNTYKGPRSKFNKDAVDN